MDDDGDGWLWWMVMLDDGNDDGWWLWMMMNNDDGWWWWMMVMVDDDDYEWWWWWWWIMMMRMDGAAANVTCHMNIPFHLFSYHHLTLAVVCLSSIIIASSHYSATSTLPYNFHSFYLTVWLWTFCRDIANYMAWLQTCCSANTLWNGCKDFQNLKTLAVLKGRNANMLAEVWMMTVVQP